MARENVSKDMNSPMKIMLVKPVFKFIFLLNRERGVQLRIKKKFLMLQKYMK